MKASRPPAVAAWLLERLGSHRTREAIAGDLAEQCQQGRSVAWYWRQVVIAIVIGNATDIWDHKVLTLRAIVLGWAASYALAKVPLPLSVIGPQQITFHQITLINSVFNSMFLIGIVHTAVVRASTGWLVGRFHRPYQSAMVLAFLSSFLLLDLPWLYRRADDALVFWKRWIDCSFLSSAGRRDSHCRECLGRWIMESRNYEPYETALSALSRYTVDRFQRMAFVFGSARRGSASVSLGREPHHGRPRLE